jgi:hypothetical protein
MGSEISAPSALAQDKLQTAIDYFKRTAEVTRDVRFQANHRLSGRSKASSYVVSFLSTYVIALSLIPNILRLEQYQSQLLLACSVVLSVFVIFTSLIDGAQNFFHRGEMLHHSARKIATINHELRLLNPTIAGAEEKFQELQTSYNDALDECPTNHDNVDFYKVMSEKPYLFVERRGATPLWFFVGWNYLRARTLKNLWAAPHIFVAVAISWIVYYFVLRSAPFLIK